MKPRDLHELHAATDSANIRGCLIVVLILFVVIPLIIAAACAFTYGGDIVAKQMCVDAGYESGRWDAGSHSAICVDVNGESVIFPQENPQENGTR